MVGLPCSGKTTLARKLEIERAALRLTPDEWQVALFGQDADDAEHDGRHTQIEGPALEYRQPGPTTGDGHTSAYPAPIPRLPACARL